MKNVRLIDFYVTRRRAKIWPWYGRFVIMAAVIEDGSQKVTYREYSLHFSHGRAVRKCLALNASIGRTS